MNYIIAGSGSPNDLDKEHIVNTMFKVVSYCKNAYFMKGSACSDFALEAARKWKDLNDFEVKLIPFDINDPHDMEKMPEIIDAFVLFLDKDIELDNNYIQKKQETQSEGYRVDTYILGAWDDYKSNNLCGND